MNYKGYKHGAWGAGASGQGEPDNTHVLLLPLLVALAALAHSPPDAGVQAMANHMNQLC